MHQKSPKTYHESKELSKGFDKTIPKPLKAGSTHCIDCKYYEMSLVLQNYGAYTIHLESLLKQIHKHWKSWDCRTYKKNGHTLYIIIMVTYLDILSPIKRVSVAMQLEIHNPVKGIHTIKEFTWTMSKLAIISDDALSKEGSYLPNYSKLGDSGQKRPRRFLYGFGISWKKKKFFFQFFYSKILY